MRVRHLSGAVAIYMEQQVLYIVKQSACTPLAGSYSVGRNHIRVRVHHSPEEKVASGHEQLGLRLVQRCSCKPFACTPLADIPLWGNNFCLPPLIDFYAQEVVFHCLWERAEEREARRVAARGDSRARDAHTTH
jgi:hypothetical protein